MYSVDYLTFYVVISKMLKLKVLYEKVFCLKSAYEGQVLLCGHKEQETKSMEESY